MTDIDRELVEVANALNLRVLYIPSKADARHWSFGDARYHTAKDALICGVRWLVESNKASAQHQEQESDQWRQLSALLMRELNAKKEWDAARTRLEEAERERMKLQEEMRRPMYCPQSYR